MKIVPSEFSNSAWDYFLSSKEIARNNFQQNVDPENLLLALIKKDNLTNKILKRNKINIKRIETELTSLLDAKAKVRYKQKTLFIGENTQKIFSKADHLRISFNDVVISTEHILYGLTYDETCGNLILTTRKFQVFRNCKLR